ncbi:MAG: glycosyltransferase family 9 protein, partial [Limnobacter sp.]|nr:glycosyltransferase family 9 protein [Limnobacter sp.]
GPGFGYAKESLACLFYSKRAGWDPQAHAVERLRELCASLLNYRLTARPVFYHSLARGGASVTAPASGTKQVWFLHATAREEKKWPIISWRELAHRFSDMGYEVKLPWGSAAEEQQAKAIAQGIDGVEVLPRMSLGELGGKMQLASLVIGVDTGLTHLAAAYYLPLVALFFATPAWRFAPRFNPLAISVGDVGAAPSVAMVYEAGSRLLRGNKV